MIARAGIAFIGAFLLTLSACKDNIPTGPSAEDFDKQSMLRNIAEGVIVPAYEIFNSSLNDLRDALEAYQNDPTTAHADQVKVSLDDAYLAWQGCAPFEIGPAADEGLKLLVNTFPVDTTRVVELIEQEDYDLTSAQNSLAKGLPAMDFVCNEFPEYRFVGANVQSFLMDNVVLLEDASAEVLNAWQQTYTDEFSINDGSDVGSSLGMLVNALNQDFELIKNAKVGIPLGKKTLGVAQPEKVEALFAEISVELIKANVLSIQAAINGAEGQGIDDLLDALDARYEDQVLSEAIDQGFDAIIQAANEIQGPLDEAIETSPQSVEVLYTAMQNQVVLLKTDMPSQLGVQITYQDNDGD